MCLLFEEMVNRQKCGRDSEKMDADLEKRLG